MNVLLTRLTVALVLGIVIGSISARPADAEKTPPLRSSYDHCLDETQGVTVAINNCIGSEYDFQDQRLNTAYKALRQSLSEDQQRRALRDQERAWIADRDKACAAPAGGGTADMLGANECRLNRTALRAAELEAQLAHP